MTRSGGGGQGDVVLDEEGSWWVAAGSRSTEEEPDCAVSLIRGDKVRRWACTTASKGEGTEC